MLYDPAMSDSAPPPPPPQDPYGQSPYGQQPYGAPGAQPGGVGPRIGARFVDFIIVGIVSNIIGTILTGGGMYSTDRSYVDVALSGIIAAIIYLAYFTLMESSRGQTLGKMLFKLHVQGPTGAKPTTAEAAKRNLWTALNVLAILGTIGTFIGGLLSLVVIIVLIVQVANESTGRVTFMDKFAGGTRVVAA